MADPEMRAPSRKEGREAHPDGPSPVPDLRARVLEGLPVSERRLRLAGIGTAVLEGGDGPPLVLLHGPGEGASKWRSVLPDLVASHRVIAPDLPGHGATDAVDGPLDRDAVLTWLDDLLARTCPSPATLVGQTLGGAIAARFAAERGDRLTRLVLVDSLGLAAFRPAPDFGAALTAYVAEPTEATYERLWSRCAFDVEALRRRMGARWEAVRAYALDRARSPALQATQADLMTLFGLPAIPPADLARIAVPTVLIWGRHDLATPLSVAREAGDAYDWPLHVIEGAADDPPAEQPQAFLDALRPALAGSRGGGHDFRRV